MRVGIFTDNDFGKINGVTTTLKAVLDHVPSDVHVRVYTSAPTAIARHDYLALRAPRVALPFYDGMDVHAPRFRAFLAAARRDRIELVHYTTPGPMGLVAQYVAWRLGLPMVGSFHTLLAEYTTLLSGSDRLGRLMREYLRWPYGRCRRVLVPSRATRDLFVASRIAPDKLQVWSRGVDTTRFHPARRSRALRDEWGVADGTPVVLYAGRLSLEKGLAAVPALWRRAMASTPGARLVFAGEGPLRSELQSALPDAVFTGPLPHDRIAETMASADLFLFPSRTDTLGNVVLEAQASGLPVLVSDAGGPQENIRDGESGHVCHATDDAMGFGGRLEALLTDSIRRQAFSHAARQYAAHRTWQGSLQPLFKTWRDTVAATGRRTARMPGPSIRES